MTTRVARLAGFGTLAAYVSWHWFALLSDPELWRWGACVAVAVTLAATLQALGSVRGRRVARLLAGAALLAAIGAGMLAAGVPARLLAPAGWEELRAQLDNGLAGISQIELPYSGPSQWTSIGILLAAPLTLAAAAAAAFWPARSWEPARRGLALALLVTLYGVAVTWQAPSAELARGLGLLACVGAFLWLPLLRGTRALTGAVALAVAGLAALPAAASIDTSDPLVDYGGWRLFGDERAVNFKWDHEYGPLDWPQRGTELFEVRGVDRPLYWKTWVLDEFDGGGWARGDGVGKTIAARELGGAPQPLVFSHQEWIEEVEFSVLALSSSVVVTTGTPEQVFGLDTPVRAEDGTTTLVGAPLTGGSSYVVRAYAPNPTTRMLKRADDGEYPRELAHYTTLLLPQDLGETGVAPAAAPADPLAFVHTPLRGNATAKKRSRAAALIADTPYERVRRLALRITRGAEGNYEAVAAVERYLLRNYEYDQEVPQRRYPLPAFLFRDLAGYCQQFSGAMALMLRFAGIPSRVVSGFAPGLPGEKRGSYVVRDTDAHSWVEVWFPQVGWVTVDPTPGAAPARTEAAITGSPGTRGLAFGAGRAASIERSAQSGPIDIPKPREQEEEAESPVGGVLGALVFAGAIAAVFAYRRRRRRLLSPEGAEPQLRELERALPRLGHPLEPGTTLLEIERRLTSAIGRDAAAYPAALRRNRYGAGRPRRPGPHERRALRSALARGHGPRLHARALYLIPPGGPSRRPR